MKPTNVLLALLFCGLYFNSTAQDITPGTTYWDQDYENLTYCFGTNSLAGPLSYGDNINNDIAIESHILTFTTPSAPLITDGCPSWIGFTGVDQAHAMCDYFRSFGGIDLSDNPYLSITAKADHNNAKLTVYIGYVESNQWVPTTSTRQTGSGTIMIDLTLSTSFQTFTYNFTNLTADNVIWSAWTDRTQVNAYGVTGQEPDTKYYISRVTVGSTSIPARTASVEASSRTADLPSCDLPTSVHASTDLEVEITTEAGGHILIDPSFVNDKAVVTDMFGRTEEFTGNDFRTQLRGVLVVSCASGNKVKKVKVVME